ncbi:transcriptional regulator, HxlR family [Chitinophaga sp. CF118]|uniref:winged helix-turn-helix transcriptional regulator n=1 Tax=Chitinophaga sp. CF118 TaxID=1884367 RepID=UPI0008F0623A|nr:helix-turn-helix domain-containing protein [Chitinophaga sp. CF118]SFE34665.1 transcriptional regulator, HxlR family [Chitinophaga sp. CF118]
MEKYMDHVDCPIRDILDRFGDKWSILILCLLGSKGKLRFTEISSHISNISQKMQTASLRSLEKDGLIVRKLYAEVPPRVEYELTTLGNSLVPYIEGLADWALKNKETITKHRKMYSKHPQQNKN